MSVSSLKFSKITFSIESLVILAALISFLSSVSLLIYYKMTSMWECLITIATLKWFAPPCKFSYGFNCDIARRKPYHIGCIEMVSAQCELSGVLQDHPYDWKPCHISCISKVCLQCVSSYGCFYWYYVTTFYHKWRCLCICCIITL